MKDAALKEKWGLVFKEVPEEHLTSEEFWGHVASFVTEVYKIPRPHAHAGHHLKIKP